MSSNEDMRYIVTSIGIPATLEQLAEECAELGQASLKLARVLRGENPTPISVVQATERLGEEAADVRVCLEVLRLKFPVSLNTEGVEQAKLNRWLERLENSGKGGGENA